MSPAAAVSAGAATLSATAFTPHPTAAQPGPAAAAAVVTMTMPVEELLDELAHALAAECDFRGLDA
jgi:hypothetical protein